MKLLRLLFLAPVLSLLFLLSGTPFSSCTKTTTVHDTVTIRHDTTIIKHDTTVVVDSVYDITSGLVAYYNFNGGSLQDSSGYNNNITFNNATVTSDRFGRTGNAYLFNGSGSYMQVPSSASLNPDNITLFAIIKVNGFWNANCHANQILGKGYPDYINGFYTMRFTDINACSPPVDSAHEYFEGGYGDNNPQGTAAGATPDTIPVKKGVWYTLAYTFDGHTSNFYINGVLKDSRQKTVAFTDNTHDLFIGKHEDPLYPYWFNGVIDEIRIYNRALGQGAITQLYNLNN